MSDTENSDYYARRAVQERTIAEAASEPSIKAIHEQMADRYEQRVDSRIKDGHSLAVVPEL